MRPTSDIPVPRLSAVVVALVALLVVTAGCGGGDPSALSTAGNESPVGAGDGRPEPGTSKKPPRTTKTQPPGRGAPGGPGSTGASPSRDQVGPTSSDGATGPATGGGRTGGPGTNGGSSGGGPGSPDTKPGRTGEGATTPDTNKPPASTTTTTPGGGGPPGPGGNGKDVVNAQVRPNVPVINEALVALFEQIVRDMAAGASVVQETEDVVRLKRDAPPEAQAAFTGDAATLVAAAEHVRQTGDVSTYQGPPVQRALDGLRAKTAQGP